MFEVKTAQPPPAAHMLWLPANIHRTRLKRQQLIRLFPYVQTQKCEKESLDGSTESEHRKLLSGPDLV